MLYHVTVGAKTVEVEIEGERITVDGESLDVELLTVPGTQLRHLMVGHQSHRLVAQPGARGLWNIALGGRTLSVEVIDERSRTIREMSGASAVEAEKVLLAPMPGLIVRVEVEVGATVSAGQGIIVVEAMKMENELKAPAEGVVTKIEVSVGSTVEKGAVLIVLE